MISTKTAFILSIVVAIVFIIFFIIIDLFKKMKQNNIMVQCRNDIYKEEKEMKKYYVIFESEVDDFDGVDIGGFGSGLGYDLGELPDTVTIHQFPADMPILSSYDFQSYHNGYAKGYNDCLKKLQGMPLGEYDPEKDDTRKI